MNPNDEALLAMYELELDQNWGDVGDGDVLTRPGRVRRVLAYAMYGLALSTAYGAGMHYVMLHLAPRPMAP